MEYIKEIIYLIASLTFVAGLKLLGNPNSARKGNLYAAAGMILAIIATMVFHKGHVPAIIYILIFSAIVIGTIIGWMTARRVKMTQMPELVSLFNGMGGACAALISMIEFEHYANQPSKVAMIAAGMVIGAVSFSGSMIAFMKLNGTMAKAIRLPKYNIMNTILMIGILVFAVFLVASGTQNVMLVYLLLALALIYGILFVIPIGGADMPVVISLLNSFTGLAAAFGGFLYGNMVMLTGGILVGSAGTILTLAMCNAMNRPLRNVIFGAFGEQSGAESSGEGPTGNIKEVMAGDVAILMNYAQRVVIVPGYGLAVAQAQHAIHDLEQILVSRGVEVKYAVHPVAGRMPGHMNVLLAESNVAYEKLVEMEDINPEFPNTDVVLVVGANDVVNPAAHNDPSSPIYGMPILDVENARQVIVNKRSMKPGYAGIENELFFHDNTSMLFGDAKAAINKVIAELKDM